MFTKDLSKGDVGPEVYRLQNFLERLGHGDFIPTGFFGGMTKLAVQRFQKTHNLPTTGNFMKLSRGVANEMTRANGEFLYWVAAGCLGMDASPSDFAPDELGCAETVNEIHKKAFGANIWPFPAGLSTYQLYGAMAYHDKIFKKVIEPVRGDIIISPTNYGNGKVKHGHTGIFASATEIMSNDSATGKFLKNYTLEAWKKHYQGKGGYPVFVYRRL